ncbi:MAG: YeeE/YedE thiosulfate transporter family protein [Proteobacteria bacterium]|nr:YeeE/YedE thiosulfate transporter family protein [Pseudomonadota bacterium]
MGQFFPNGIAHYLAGGLIIGAAVGLLFVTTGLIGGMSTVYSSTWSFFSNHPFFQREDFVGSRKWRLAYAAGLVLGGVIWLVWLGAGTWQTGVPIWQLVLGGFLVGFGARLSNGCTSGHGICGMASLQLPSLLAVLTFLATGIVTAQLVAWLGGH